jgi:hypothetical protein
LQAKEYKESTRKERAISLPPSSVHESRRSCPPGIFLLVQRWAAEYAGLDALRVL